MSCSNDLRSKQQFLFVTPWLDVDFNSIYNCKFQLALLVNIYFSYLSNWQVRLHLLTAVMKCFFKRPPETQKALGEALSAGLADLHQVEF